MFYVFGKLFTNELSYGLNRYPPSHPPSYPPSYGLVKVMKDETSPREIQDK